MDKRRLTLHTLKRFARWTDRTVWTGLMDRTTGIAVADGPVLELELGYRAAVAVLGS